MTRVLWRSRSVIAWVALAYFMATGIHQTFWGVDTAIIIATTDNAKQGILGVAAIFGAGKTLQKIKGVNYDS